MAGEVEPNVKQESVSSKISLTRLRERVRSYIDKHHYDSALFWADKLVSLSKGCVEDVYWYAQTLYHTGQYHRAVHLIRSRKADMSHAECRYLAAKCLYECKEWEEALNVLDRVDYLATPASSLLANLNLDGSSVVSNFDMLQNIGDTGTETSITNQNVEYSMALLRGKIYEAMDNRNLAMVCFREALKHDVYCFEALDLLVSHHMMTSQEERNLIDSLPFKEQCSEEEIELVKFLYENKLKKYNKPSTLAVPSSLGVLEDNIDIVVNLAERHYYNCGFRECYKITALVLTKDPYNNQCLPLHIAVLYELKNANALFFLAHKLVESYPSKPVSWFAVGCYYLLTGKIDPARRYLSKATTLDRAYGPAWLAFGHSFAAENEHDQAMAAYFTASQIMQGCHLPVLYIGLEYGLTNNFKLAERFFSQALGVAPEDPFVLHEMGVIAFQNQDWCEAERYFLQAMDKVQVVSMDMLADKWEPLLNNLGHTYRKLRKYDQALEYHKQAEKLSPQNPSTYSAIGYIYALQGDNFQAVDYFHKALGIRRDDAFSTTMLGNVMEALMTEMLPCDGGEDDEPHFQCQDKLQSITAKLTVDRCVDGSPLEVQPQESSDGTRDKSNSCLADTDADVSSIGDGSSMAIEEIEMDGSD
ncbi:cell division cycle protein 16 homolog [Gigantopelta aegis]|uniref:cell division cycle protein 16 homolog n=1 Tax=Gigantopelta aegis TaxID=1735272 RepID=UPI001B888613|nr:cell division cycle protein 16 homolog [Gigantopelta aegis]